MAPAYASVLFYDSGCGPCSIFARAVQVLGRGKIAVAGLDSPEAEVALREMSESQRFGSMHLRRGRETFSAEAALYPLVEGTLGRRTAIALGLIRPIGLILLAAYRWTYRQKMSSTCERE